MRFPFTSRARAERKVASLEASLTSADTQLEDKSRSLNIVRTLIREMHERHKPYPGEWAKVGNYGGGRTEWWCTECRTHWPCRPWRELRRLYSATHSTTMPKPVPEMEVTLRPKPDPKTPLAA